MQPEIYHDFVSILQQHQRGILSLPLVYGKLLVLFESAPELIDGLRRFVPETAARADALFSGSRREER